jgi:hypothetical protein
VAPIRVEIREYDRLFLSEDPVAVHGKEWLKDLNPNSLKVLSCVIDPSISGMCLIDINVVICPLYFVYVSICFICSREFNLFLLGYFSLILTLIHFSFCRIKSIGSYSNRALWLLCRRSGFQGGFLRAQQDTESEGERLEEKTGSGEEIIVFEDQ